MGLFQRVLRAGEGKKRKLVESIVPLVNEHEEKISALSDEDLAYQTVLFRERLAQGEELDDLLPEAFATVREAASRVLGQRHYDVQIMGGTALHFGWIAEMKTGEGKTLVSTLPAYLNGLTGEGVHIITVNDYLARRDAEWMGGVHRFLGFEIGLIQSDDFAAQRQPAYAADITYGTNNEFGFDYLRDNMAMRPQDRVQRGHKYAIVDEVDSILVDEARTPLIISGRMGDTAKWYSEFSKLVPRLVPDLDYEVDEAKKIVTVTEEGVSKTESFLGISNLYDQVHTDLVHHLTIALKAKALFHLEIEYIVRDGEVKIVDEFTGRILEGRRYSEGLHQAIEAKENVQIKEESQTLATITLQNYFRLYEKLSGMTGTAETEAGEFKNTYDMDVVVIPPNVPIARFDQGDLIYKTEEAKFTALVDDVSERYENGQPVLIGTISIDKNEKLSRALSKRGVKHQVLNAKQHEREAAIIAQAGQEGAVTVATNMAGRGVDIILGGNPEHIALEEMVRREIGIEEDPELFQRLRAEKEQECEAARQRVLDFGGLYVIGTERHESRRIDNQLRGRSGRQGDPGESRFYLSLDDDLMRLFARQAIAGIMNRLKLPEDMPIEAKMVTKAIERAQRQVEERNFEIRKNVLKYDEVMNKQREVVYSLRHQVLDGKDLHEVVLETVGRVIDNSVRRILLEEYAEDWDTEEVARVLRELYPCNVDFSSYSHEYFDEIGVEGIVELVTKDAYEVYAEKGEEIGRDVLGALERQVLLSVLDNKWREHLYEMEYLREGINLRALAGTDPLAAYQREGFDMFGEMLDIVDEEFVKYMYRVRIVEKEAREPKKVTAQGAAKVGPDKSDASGGRGDRARSKGKKVPSSTAPTRRKAVKKK